MGFSNLLLSVRERIELLVSDLQRLADDEANLSPEEFFDIAEELREIRERLNVLVANL